MELKLTPIPKNPYPIVGILIKGNAPKHWLAQIETLNIDLATVKSYAIPSHKANVLYGCMLFANIQKDLINNQQQIVAVADNLYIPTYTDIYPKLTAGEWKNNFKKPCIYLPEIGIFELEEPINWFSILKNQQPLEYELKTVLEHYFIPKKIKSVQMLMTEEEILKQIENPEIDAADLKDVPFNMDKVMAGNDKEVEKYLKYIEQNPDFAMKYPLPLDVYGASRNSNEGVFNFDGASGFFGDFFAKLFSGNSTSKGNKQSASNNKNQSCIRLIIINVVCIVLGVNAIKIIPSLIDSIPSVSVATLKPMSSMVLPVVIILVILVILFFTNKLTFGKGTFFQKLIINGCLFFAFYQLLNPIFTYYDASLFFKILICTFSFFAIYKVYNLYSKFLKKE